MEHAERLGMEVVDYILTNTMDFRNPYPDGPVQSVTYYPAGVAGKTTPTNQQDYKGRPAYNKWKQHIQRVAGGIGYQFVDFLDADDSVTTSKTEPNTVDKETNLTESVLREVDSNLDKELSYKDADGETQTITARAALRSGQDHPAYKDALKIKQQIEKDSEEDSEKEKADKQRDTEKDKEEQPQDKDTEKTSNDQEKPGQLSGDDFSLPQEKQPIAPDKTKKQKIIGTVKEKWKSFSDKQKSEMRKVPEAKRTVGKSIVDKVKGIPKAIKKTFQHKVHVYKDSAKATKKLVTGQKLDKKDKSALAQVALDAAIVTGAVAMGGAGGGALALSKAVASKMATLWVKDISILGIGKSALFAGKEDMTEDELLMKTVEHFGTWLQTKKLTEDDYLELIDSMGNETNEQFMDNPHNDPKWVDSDEDDTIVKLSPGIDNKYDKHMNEVLSKEYFKRIFESIDLPVEIGDTVYMGKFKNKPVVVKTIDWNEKGDLLINGKSALRMRIPDKSNVFGDDPRYTKESVIKAHENNLIVNDLGIKSLLAEGGAYGHMAHPFDDGNLKFSDIKKMIDLGLRGKLNVEQSVSEKTDGQNLMVTWKDGKLKAARNKSTIKEPMDINAVQTKFAGRGDIEKAFVFAMKDLQKAISGLSDKQKEKIFKGGRAFVNLEIIYPATENVIVYDSAVLQFHGVIEYDESANIVGQVTDGARMLQGMIAQTNADVQKNFKIIKPQILNIKPNNDYTKKRDYFFGKLKKLQKEFNLKDQDTLGLYHQMWWESFIQKQAKKYIVPRSVIEGLTKRWAFFDKSFRIDKKNIEDTDFLIWAKDFDKKSHKDQVKKNMLPFETLIFEVGAEILKNVENYLTASPDKAVQKIKDEIAKVAKDIERGGDIEKIKKLKQQLEKIQQAGGLDKLVPSEGLVFIYGGKTYKITGLFGPVNGILGLLKFSR
jgi:hypothetical protein